LKTPWKNQPFTLTTPDRRIVIHGATKEQAYATLGSYVHQQMTRGMRLPKQPKYPRINK